MALHCSVDADRTDAGIVVTLTVENTDEQAVDLTFHDGQTIDATASVDGEQRWRYGEGRMFTQAIRTVTLDPGEQRRESVTWPDPVPGTYEVTAWLCAEGVECRDSSVVEC